MIFYSSESSGRKVFSKKNLLGLKTLLARLICLTIYLTIFNLTNSNAEEQLNLKMPTRHKILALGDSLTAGYGLDISQSYPSQLEKALIEKGYQYEVINGGVSGDTTAGGLRRLPWLFKQDISILILALGANDGLRGFSPIITKENLAKIIDLARTLNPKIKILLAGMYAPPNMGESYKTAYQNTFSSIAKEKNVEFLPFLLDGVAGVPSLNIADGIHPNEEGYKKISELLMSSLEPLLALQ